MGVSLRREHSLVGPGLVRSTDGEDSRRRSSRSGGWFGIACAVTIAFLLSVVAFNSILPGQSHQTRTLSQTTIPIVLINQHYDTVMFCAMCFLWLLPQGPHAWNDAKGPDGVYGTVDDCPHCSAYCAPGAIAMIATYRGVPAIRTQQDDIYDAGKLVGEAAPLDKLLSTHGVGMFDGTGGRPGEVQVAMSYAVGPINQHNQWDGTALTPAQMQTYIGGMTPILWLDHKGFPVNQSPTNPPGSYRVDEGHAKVIAGYDDSNTPADVTDDLCLIYDPWPEYNDKGILPVNCTTGPGGSWDPYWQPLNDVNLSDISDIYDVDTYPLVPEFTTVLVPVLGMVIVALVALRRRQWA